MKPFTILVVDDSTAMRSLLVSTLESLGAVTVLQAPNGFEALRILPRQEINLLLTDINMPDINGLELLNFVRTNPIYKDLPVVIISTEGSSKDIEKGMSLGASEYLVKPFQPDQLLEIVRRFL
ncbi:response regulator [Trichlorobacter ammonificans]|uniref:Chemotaxis protein CheY homolog n=1 Tax=Trichlorobacter ammonificans TaxID=2916410 RepID=A0ABM9D8Y1_9BACT|nr:response regulator [Trichlorobacter ammonificans]CAH2031173.1 Chemotaxis protein CheY homolog [Trichlorobacter ammonificans]